MKYIGKALVGIVVLALLIFTVVFLANAYNTGKIGNKAEKIADTFTEDIVGTWTGKYSISAITFNEDSTTSLTMLGIALNGTYSDSYDLETQKHTLTLKYQTVLGISVERTFEAKLEEDSLKLTDTQLDSVELRYTRAGAESGEKVSNENKNPDSKNDETETTVYNPGADVYKQALIGEWVSSNSPNSGYKFAEDSSIEIKLMGIGNTGSYSVSVDEATNRCVLEINYATVLGVDISNRYYITIADDVLSLAQRGAESITTTYTKVKEAPNN